MGFSFPMMWDACGILKKVKTFRYRIPLCKCGINVGFTTEVTFCFYFLVQNLEYVKIMPMVVVGRWLQSNGATVSGFFFRYIIQNETLKMWDNPT